MIINPKVWEKWYVQLPGEIELYAATIRCITEKVVKIDYIGKGGHTYLQSFKRADVEFVELIPQ
jgi:hypothetical protein